MLRGRFLDNQAFDFLGMVLGHECIELFQGVYVDVHNLAGKPECELLTERNRIQGPLAIVDPYDQRTFRHERGWDFHRFIVCLGSIERALW